MKKYCRILMPPSNIVNKKFRGLPAGTSGFFVRVEEFFVFVKGKAVGHARDIIAYEPFLAYGFNIGKEMRRQEPRLPYVGVKEPFQHPFGLVRHADEAVVFV